MSTLQVLDAHLTPGNLEAYIYRVNQIPLLTLEEEQTLAKNFRDQEDLVAAKRLVMAHLRYVVTVARSYRGYGLPLSDLIQEGNIGLMKAVKRFDPNYGVRLVSFAVHWIKAEIHEFIIRNWRIVKIATTKSQRKLFFNLRHFKKRLGWFTPEEIQAVAKDLGVSEKDVQVMEQRLNAMDCAFDADERDEEEDQAYRSPSYYLEHQDSDPALIVERNESGDQAQDRLTIAFRQLDQRSQEILHARLLADEKSTLQDLAVQHGISAERIRQLEQKALQKLKSVMLAQQSQGI